MKNNEMIGTIRETNEEADIEGYWRAESSGDVFWLKAEDKMGNKIGYPDKKERWTYIGREKP